MPAAFNWLKRQPVWIWLSVWTFLVLVQIISPLWYSTPDACAYLSIARSLATTGHAANLGNPHLRYGIGYPFFISMVFLWKADPFLILSMIHAALAVLYVAGTHVWAKRYVPEASLLIALLAVGNVLVLCILRRPLSEALFLPVMIWLLNAWSAVVRDGLVRPLPLLAAALLIAVLVVIRQAGILFVSGFALQMLIGACRRQLAWWRATALTLAVGCPAVLAVGTMIAVDNHVAGEQHAWSHWDIFFRSKAKLPSDRQDANLVAQCVEGTRVAISDLGRLVIPGMFGSYAGARDWLDPNLILYLPLSVLVMMGWFRFVSRRADAFALTLPLYLALHIYWPFNQAGRFFVPLLPLFLVCLWLAMERFGSYRLAMMRTVLVAHLAVALGYWVFTDLPQAIAANRLWPYVAQVAKPMRESPASIQVASDVPHATNGFLMYVLDESVSTQERQEPLNLTADWLVTSVHEAIPTGFCFIEDVGPYRLMRRQKTP